MFIHWFRRISFPLKTRWLVAALRRIQRRDAPSGWDVFLLALAWGNLGYAAGFSYLRHVGERAARSTGPILECGSGATTLLIAALTAKRGVDFWVLEHNRVWFDYLSRVLSTLGFTHVHLVYAPLRDYDDYRWYDAQDQALPSDIGLVICDGPPGSTPGGRYGLMPVMGTRLAADCTVLLDDTHRAGERQIIELWRRYRPLRVLSGGRSHTELALL